MASVTSDDSEAYEEKLTTALRYMTVGEWSEAKDALVDAFELNPKDPRAYVIRSKCYYMLEQYGSAVPDAIQALRLDQNNSLAMLHYSQSVRAMGEVSLAHQVLEKLIKAGYDTEEFKRELALPEYKSFSRGPVIKSRTKPTSEKDIAKSNVIWVGNVFATIRERDLINHFAKYGELAKIDFPHDRRFAYVFYENRESAQKVMENADRINIQGFHLKVNYANFCTDIDDKEALTNPKNPKSCSTLWVGNIPRSMSDTVLAQLFSRCGLVVSCNVLDGERDGKKSAFVNYSKSEEAAKAMETLQGFDCKEYDRQGSKLLLKFRQPRKPTNSGSEKERQECHFWRKGYCKNGTNCLFRHLEHHRGMDS